MKSIAFVGSKDGVGTTSLVYHLAWMHADLGLNVLAVDLDPQATLTTRFLDDERLEELWSETGERRTVYGALRPLLEGTGDVSLPHVEDVAACLRLVAGDLALSAWEMELSSQWPDCLDGKPRSFRVLPGLWRILRLAAEEMDADLVLVDVGPNLGAITRAALVAADHLVISLASDLSSLQGLRNLGPTIRRWREEWAERRDRNPVKDLGLPEGAMRPAGYIVMQHAVRLDRPVTAYARWMERIPQVYREAVSAEEPQPDVGIDSDPNRLATLRHDRSLMPLAQDARKPMFFLRPADGAIGGHAGAVRECYSEFRDVARKVAERAGVAFR